LQLRRGEGTISEWEGKKIIEREGGNLGSKRVYSRKKFPNLKLQKGGDRLEKVLPAGERLGGPGPGFDAPQKQRNRPSIHSEGGQGPHGRKKRKVRRSRHRGTPSVVRGEVSSVWTLEEKQRGGGEAILYLTKGSSEFPGEEGWRRGPVQSSN